MCWFKSTEGRRGPISWEWRWLLIQIQQRINKLIRRIPRARKNKSHKRCGKRLERWIFFFFFPPFSPFPHYALHFALLTKSQWLRNKASGDLLYIVMKPAKHPVSNPDRRRHLYKLLCGQTLSRSSRPVTSSYCWIWASTCVSWWDRHRVAFVK